MLFVNSPKVLVSNVTSSGEHSPEILNCGLFDLICSLNTFIVFSKLQHDQNNSNGSQLISVIFIVLLWICHLLDFLFYHFSANLKLLIFSESVYPLTQT